MAIENATAESVITTAEKYVKETNLEQLDEKGTRVLIGELQSEIICDVHRIDFMLKHRVLLIDQLKAYQRKLEFATAPTVEAIAETPVSEKPVPEAAA